MIFFLVCFTFKPNKSVHSLSLWTYDTDEAPTLWMVASGASAFTNQIQQKKQGAYDT